MAELREQFFCILLQQKISFSKSYLILTFLIMKWNSLYDTILMVCKFCYNLLNLLLKLPFGFRANHCCYEHNINLTCVIYCLHVWRVAKNCLAPQTLFYFSISWSFIEQTPIGAVWLLVTIIIYNLMANLLHLSDSFFIFY